MTAHSQVDSVSGSGVSQVHQLVIVYDYTTAGLRNKDGTNYNIDSCSTSSEIFTYIHVIYIA